MIFNEERLIVGNKGVVGRAIDEIFKGTLHIDMDTSKPVVSDNKYVVMQICIPYTDGFVETVVNYIMEYRPRVVLNHATCAIGATKKIADVSGMPVVHCPVNGRHPHMVDEIKAYGFFVGADVEEWGQMACDYIERQNLRTYLCETSEITEMAKIASTELLRKNIEFYQTYKRRVRNGGLNWAEFVEFMESIHRNAPKGVWLNRAFQRAGRIDSDISGKHCISRNKVIIKDE